MRSTNSPQLLHLETWR